MAGYNDRNGIFGWSYPPGCSGPPEEYEPQGYEPNDEDEEETEAVEEENAEEEYDEEELPNIDYDGV